MSKRPRRWLVIGASVLAVIVGIGAAAPTGEYTIKLGPFDLLANSGHHGIMLPRRQPPRDREAGQRDGEAGLGSQTARAARGESGAAER